MKTWQVIVAGLVLLATAGCRSDPAIPILERELRLKEDEIYRLQATVEELRDSGESCRERTSRGSKSNESESESSAPRHRSDSGGKPPMVELPSKPASEMPDTLKGSPGMLPPGLDVPENLRGPSKPLHPKENVPDPLPKPTAGRTMSSDPGEPEGPSLERDVGSATSRPRHVAMASRSASAEPFTPGGDSRRVAAIVLNRTLTGGIGAEDRPGDQGLLVVVEPRDRAGRMVDAPADMSVVVIDKALGGDAARVARWDFTAAEIASMFRRTGSGGAIHLTTAWPAEPPAHNKLHLFVRYVTADGRKLQADAPIEVALPGDKTVRWNQADSAPRDERPEEHGEAMELRQPGDAPVARVPGPPPRTVERPDDSQSRRPVWSPERRF